MADPTALPDAFARLLSLGVERISCIGGRRFAGSLVDASLVDDLYLTTSARTGGTPNTSLPPGAFAGNLVVRKHGTAEETGVLFEHRTIGRR
jgi:riboflavin biosynthesis pyrimidine reductase